MSIGQILQSIADVLGTGQGSLVLGIAALLAIAAPVADRYVIRRKRIHFRVQYNSKIGLTPVDLHDGAEGKDAKRADPRLVQVAQLLDRMSIVVIRIRNTGSFDVAPEDFETPISFTFGQRVIWDARVSEPTDHNLRQLVHDNMEFFAAAPDSPTPAGDGQKLATVRKSLPQRLTAWLGTGQPGGQQETTVPPQAPPQWHGVRLARLSLKRKEKFKLVVVLRELADDRASGETSKEVLRAGRLAGGRIKDEKQQRRITWPVITAAVGVLLTGALIATLITGASRPAGDPAVPCADGALNIVGSSAFSPIVGTIAQAYSAACPEAEVTTEPTGSIAGVRELSALDPQRRDRLAALSDGKSGAAGGELIGQSIAVIQYAVLINDSVGVEKLTVRQLRDIYAGRIQDWAEIRPGRSLPIRLVGRGSESGSRRTFEQTVLGTSEGALSSDSCLSRDRVAQAPTIRCERGTEAQLVAAVAATEGAIGYADVPTANAAKIGGKAVALAQLDEVYPEPSGIRQGYPFWTTEYLYTRGMPDNGSVLKSFIDYLRSPTARAELQDKGYPPCIDQHGQLHPLCR
ncbi:PstS family phosphate ABC transporter substrate-binding protein [Amycolatopsis aidingensis]|uniref:PstS family phosphate ABC transporter substrate-binding protein n=1 Tax=Amycolatopsis aidingensis TaxID=2842453 RepID=UPI001C0C1D1A|nr:substrate-binding domain-containing protein [Amycolatopsis aidingensis]